MLEKNKKKVYNMQYSGHFQLFGLAAGATQAQKIKNVGNCFSLPAIIKLLDSKINEIFKKVFFVKNKKMSI